MAKTLFCETCDLSNEKINDLSLRAQEVCSEFIKKDPKEIKRASLSLEEILLHFQSRFGATHHCMVTCKKKQSQIYFRIEDIGEKNNPLDVEDKEESADILDYLGIGTRYKYTSHKNIVSFSVATDKKNRSLTYILVSLALAFVLGTLCLRLPEETRMTLSTDIIEPLFQKMIALLTAFASPLIFLAVTLGIVGLEDITTIGTIGKRLLKGMLLTYVFAAGLMIIAASLFLGGNTSINASAGGIEGIIQLVLDIIPNNLIEPFYNDNHLQIISLSIFMGVILLILGDSGKKITSAMNELSIFVNRMMMTICKAIPLIVFLGIFNIIITNKVAQIAQIWKTVVIFFVISFVVIMFGLIRTRVVTGLPFSLIIRKQRAPLMINLTTSSQVAAFPYSTECCKSYYGIDDKLVDFALPIEMVAFMPCGAVMIGLIPCTLASLEGVGFTPMFLIKCFLLAIIIAISAPPIPGSGFVVVSVALSGMGMSAAGMPIAVIIITICGYFLPLFNSFLMQLELLIAAYKEKKVNTDIMNDPGKMAS